MFQKVGPITREWYLFFQSMEEELRAIADALPSGPEAGGGAVLLEGGDYMLLEDGFSLILLEG
jgi:hypothetical protein